MRPGILTLTTDFGIGGPYVAALKGVLLELAPGTQFVDVCHTISPQNILEGGFVLAGIVDVFPKGTVHLAVVDPGVGTERRLIAVSIGGSMVCASRQWPDHRRGRGQNAQPESGKSPTRPCGAPSSRPRFTAATSSPRPRAHLLRGGDPAELGPAREQVHHSQEL